jgi:hypothetical protein
MQVLKIYGGTWASYSNDAVVSLAVAATAIAQRVHQYPTPKQINEQADQLVKTGCASLMHMDFICVDDSFAPIGAVTTWYETWRARREQDIQERPNA